MNLTPHEVTDACALDHCAWHNVDEPVKGAHQYCLECGHVYRTARELRRAHRAVLWGLRRYQPDPRNRLPLRRVLWLMATVRVHLINACAMCHHDFI